MKSYFWIVHYKKNAFSKKGTKKFDIKKIGILIIDPAKSTIEILEKGVKYVQSEQQKH